MSNVVKYIEDTKDQIHYCEATILPNGNVFDSIPSHIYFILNRLEESKSDIEEKMSMRANPLYWLVDYTGVVSVYYDFCIASYKMSDEQKESLIALQKAGRIRNPYEIYIPKEMLLCKALDNGDMETVKRIEKEYFMLMSGIIRKANCKRVIE